MLDLVTKGLQAGFVVAQLAGFSRIVHVAISPRWPYNSCNVPSIIMAWPFSTLFRALKTPTTGNRGGPSREHQLVARLHVGALGQRFLQQDAFLQHVHQALTGRDAEGAG